MFIVEGTIGAGKSTFLKLFKEYNPLVKIFFEPVHTWQSAQSDNSLLAHFYQNPYRWAYTMETISMINRVQDYLQDKDLRALKLMERSIYSGYYCFALNGYNQGFMTSLEWHLYTSFFNFLVAKHCAPPLGFIYLKVEPTRAYERIIKRKRSSEENISLEYLQQLDICHENFLIHKKNILPYLQSVPILILDCNEEFESNSDKAREHLIKVESFMNTISPLFKNSGGII